MLTLLCGHLKQVIFPSTSPIITSGHHHYFCHCPNIQDNNRSISFSGLTGELLHRLRRHAWQAVCTLQISGTSVCDVPGCYCVSVRAVEDKAAAFQVRTDSVGITCQPAGSCHRTEAALLEEGGGGGGGEITRLQPHFLHSVWAGNKSGSTTCQHLHATKSLLNHLYVVSSQSVDAVFPVKAATIIILHSYTEQPFYFLEFSSCF